MQPTVEIFTHKTKRDSKLKKNTYTKMNEEIRHLNELSETGLISDYLYRLSLLHMLEKHFSEKLSTKIDHYVSHYYQLVEKI